MSQLHRCLETSRLPMGKGSASSDDSWHHPSLLRDLTASPAAPQLRCALSWNLPAQQTRSIFSPAARCPLRRSPCERSHYRATAGTTSGKTQRFPHNSLPFFSWSGEQEQSSPRPTGSAPGASPVAAVSGPPASGAIPPGAPRDRGSPRPPWDRDQPRDSRCLRLKIHIYRARTQREEGKTPPPPLERQ